MLGHQAARQVVVVPGIVADVAGSDGRGAGGVAGGAHLHLHLRPHHHTAPPLLTGTKGTAGEKSQ